MKRVTFTHFFRLLDRDKIYVTIPIHHIPSIIIIQYIMRKLLFLLLLLPVALCGANREKPVTVSREAAIADLDSLVALIEEVEVEPYSQLDKEVFYKAVADAKSSFTTDSITPRQMYLTISRLVGMFRQGHLGVSTAYNIIGADKVFPLANIIKIEPGSHKIIITFDTTVGDIPVKQGEEILSVNGQKAQALVDKFLKHTSWETDAFGCKELSEIMDYMLWCENPDTQTFKVELSDKGKKRTVTFNSLPLKECPSAPKKKYKPYEYQMLNDSVMLFSFKSCTWDREFSYFLRKMFKEAKDKNVAHLIIDVRNNGGGNSNAGDEVCRYLTDREFSGFGGSKIKMSQKIMDKYKGIMDLPYKVDSIYNYMEQDELEMNLPYETKYRFPGKTYLLTGPGTFSSASNFAWAYWKFVPGTVIGEETGGVNICVGDVITETLPNSKYSIYLPWKVFYHYGAKDGDPIHGTIPDIKVAEEQALDRTLQLIETGK